jgi:hypothetical protein
VRDLIAKAASNIRSIRDVRTQWPSFCANDVAGAVRADRSLSPRLPDELEGRRRCAKCRRSCGSGEQRVGAQVFARGDNQVATEELGHVTLPEVPPVAVIRSVAAHLGDVSIGLRRYEP